MKIKWHISFFLYLVFALFGGLIKEVSIILILLIMHELGHFLFLKIFKYEISQLDIYPFGIIMTFNEHKNDFIFKKLLIASGGIIVNIILCFLLVPFKDWFMANLFIILINLIPVFPLDGGRMINSILNYIMPYKYSRKSLIVFGIIATTVLLLLLLLFFRRIYLLLVIMLIFKFNFEHYRDLRHDWVLFTTNKYLYPNKRLNQKRVKHWFKHPVNSIFDGKNNIFDFDGYQLKEEVILKDYIEKAR